MLPLQVALILKIQFHYYFQQKLISKFYYLFDKYFGYCNQIFMLNIITNYQNYIQG